MNGQLKYKFNGEEIYCELVDSFPPYAVQQCFLFCKFLIY